MLKKGLILLFFIGSFANIFSQNDSEKHLVIPHTSPALRFTENLGQWDNNIIFRAQLDGGLLFVEKTGLTFNFYDKIKYRRIHSGGIIKGEYKDMDIKGHAYKVLFKGCNPNSMAEKYQKGSDYENFFIGKDKNKWRGNVQNYHQIILRNLYKDIDYEAITSARGLKYNFYIKANADPDLIKLEYQGVDKIKLKNGTLTFKLEVNEVIEQKPYAYQLINGQVVQVKCNYVLKNNILSFEFPDGYERNYSLVIDPVLVFAAQSGSTADNFGMTATYDKQGNLYSGGTVFDVGYPFVAGSYSSVFNGPPAYGNTDVVITKYNSTGNALIYSTYLGGSGAEIVTSLITDSLNNLYLYGATGSANFPIQGGLGNPFYGGDTLKFQFNGTYFNNGTDIYVGKFNPAGSALLASTYIGGTKNDGVNHNNKKSNFSVPLCFFNTVPSPSLSFSINQEYQADSLQFNYGDQYRGEIQLDKNLNVYIASSTRSTDFPIQNPIYSTLSGKQDAVVFKLNNSLSTLIYSTYLGGSGNDAGYSLIVDDTLQVYITGGTYSSNFPTKPGCYQTAYNGGKADGFISKISAAGNTLLKSTYIGTSNYDQSYFIQKDLQGRIYVYGQSQGNMPVTPGVYSNPGSHQFISRLDNQLTNLNRSTVFGSGTNTIDISPSAFAVDICNGNIYLSGWGGSFITCSQIHNMPVTPNALNSTSPNGVDFYLMALGPNMNSLLYGTYFGGNQSQEHVDGGTSRFDNKGIIYQSVCAGCTSYSISLSNPPNFYIGAPGQDFPVTPGAWPAASTVSPGLINKSNNCNNGVFKLDFKLQNTLATLNSNTITGCAPLTVTFTNGTPGTGYTWYLLSGNTTSTTLNPVVTFNNPGTYTISLVVKDTTKCVKKDSAIKIITVNPKPTPAFTSTITPCLNTFTATNTSSGGNSFIWNFGDATATSTLTNPTHSYASSGNYTVTLTATNSFGCKDSIKQPVSVFIFNPGVASGSIICNGYSANVSASGGTSYTWSPSAQVSNTSIANPIVTPTSTTIYTVTIFNNTAGNNCLRTLTTNVIVNPKPNANFNYTMNPCGGGVTFNDLSTANITAWQWTLSPAATSTVQNPYNFYSAGGTHSISLIVTNADGCKDTSAQIITVGIPPPVSASGGSLICRGYHAQLSATGGVTYQWTPTISLNLPFTANPEATPTISTQYSVVITTSLIVNGVPCQFLLTTNVNVTQPSVIPVNANANPVIVTTGSATTLTYIGDPGALVTWLPPGSTTPGVGYTVTAYPDRPTTYTAVASYGACKESAVVRVDAYSAGCLDGDVFVPNTFTPNGDTKNDLLFVRGLKVEEIYFAVYNRWGEMVFETNDKTKGWDGIYKGRPADVGVFGWYLKVKCINGEESFKKGNVTLVR